MNKKTEELITKLEEKGIPFNIEMLENGRIIVSSQVPLDSILNEVGIVNENSEEVSEDRMDDFNIEYRGLTDHEVKFETALPYPLGNDVMMMRRLNDSVADKIANIISDAAREATDELLSYITECNAHIAYAAKVTAVAEAKEEMCRIIDKEENYNGNDECCSTSDRGHCKCHR